MNAARWKQVKPILESALEVEGETRKAFLDRVCENASLRAEVDSLLASHDKAGTGALSPGAPLLRDEEEELRFRLPAGKRVGAYEILEEIAQGGMGAVYRAVRADGQYKQHVAVKIVRADLSAELTAARFRNEQQILASLDHPNIAKILDGGTTVEGLPYFVMELIEGLPITEYCDRNRLTIDERLKLFRTVCSAVNYAHQHLVIHRDIKPGNILITSEGVPKLLDFGIAKMLDSQSMGENTTLTAAGFWLMTPQYASPEQLRGEIISTASDVYSLGLILYQLLAGHTAYRFKGRMPHDIARMVMETDPEKPSTAVDRAEEGGNAEQAQQPNTPELLGNARGESTEKLRRRLSGDLDNIVMKAIRKQPSDRYTSVDQLSEDVRRHLAGLPVLARKDTFGYRASKFIVRHKTGVTAAAAVALALLTAMAVTVREARIARAERARAERRFNDVRALAHSLMFEIHDGISNLPGSTPVRQLLVSKALRYLDSLSQEAGGDAALQRELAAAYDRVGDLQWSVDYANQGDSVGSLQSYRKALAIRESLAGAEPENRDIQMELADEYFRLANPLEAAGDFPGTLAILRKVPPIIEKLAAGSDDPKILDRQGGSYFFLARTLNEMGDPTAALDNYRRAEAIHSRIKVNDASKEALFKTHAAGDHAGIAESLMWLGDLSEATKIQVEAVQSLEHLSQSNPTNTALREFLANSYGLLGTIWKKRGDQNAALEYHRKEHQIFTELLSIDPANSLARANFAFSDDNLGEALVAHGDINGGLQRIREGLATFEGMVAHGAKDRYVSSGIAVCYGGLGMAYLRLASDRKLSTEERLKQWNEARGWYAKSSEIWTGKNKRGTLEFSERESAEAAAEGIAKCDAALQRLGAAN